MHIMNAANLLTGVHLYNKNIGTHFNPQIFYLIPLSALSRKVLSFS